MRYVLIKTAQLLSIRTTAAICFFICSVAASAAAEPEIPGLVIDGLKAYQKTGGKAALAVWLKGSALENDTTTNIGISGMFTQIETAYGKMIGFEPVRVLAISPSVRRLYLVLKFEKGPVYASFDCYKPGETWIIPMLDVHTKANQVFPAVLTNGSPQ